MQHAFKCAIHLKFVPRPVALCREIVDVVGVGRKLVRHPLFNNDPCGFELRDLVGVVGEQANARLADQHEHPPLCLCLTSPCTMSVLS